MMQRREFLKALGIGTAATAAAVVLPKLGVQEQVPNLASLQAQERAENPLYVFRGDTDTGLYRSSESVVSWAVDGEAVAVFRDGGWYEV